MSKRTLNRAGREFSLPVVSSEIDAAYDTLYGQAFETPPVNWMQFNAAVDTFVAGDPTPAQMDAFFEAATPAWAVALDGQQFLAADGFWERVVSAVTEAENKAQKTVHKGSGYFFWGCNSLRAGNDERGLLLMHEAIVEDKRTNGVVAPTWPTTSAGEVLSLDGKIISPHPANWWVNTQVIAINDALSAAGSRLQVADLRTRMFLTTDQANVFLFVHANAALFRLQAMRKEHRDNEFVARLALGHLFHLAVVAERLLAAKTGRTGLFAAQVEELSDKIGGNLKKPIPGSSGAPYSSNINTQQQANPGGTIQALLQSKAMYANVPVLAVDRALSVGYVIRNIGGHHAAAPMIIAHEVGALHQEMLALVATVVEHYY